MSAATFCPATFVATCEAAGYVLSASPHGFVVWHLDTLTPDLVEMVEDNDEALTAYIIERARGALAAKREGAAAA